MPRVIFVSKKGHSQIIVSEVSIALSVVYSVDPDWQTDPMLGKNYLRERIGLLFELLNATKRTVKVCGLSGQINIPSSSPDESIIAHLADLFLKDERAAISYDVQIKTTTVIDDRFFSNLTVQNYRSWPKAILESVRDLVALPSRTPPSENGPSERGIQVVGDFNDRFSFNEKADYASSKNVAEEIIERSFNEVDGIIRRVRGE